MADRHLETVLFQLSVRLPEGGLVIVEYSFFSAFIMVLHD